MVHKQTVRVYYLNTFKGADIYVFVQSHETHLSKIWSKNTLDVKC